MNEIIHRNLANAIVGLRLVLVFILIGLLEIDSVAFRIAGLVLLVIIALLDWVDGYVAKKCGIVSRVGGMLDTLGDRITENILFIYFSYKQIIPVAVPLFFITRSFLADFIRSLNFQKGIGTFAVNTSVWGKRLVSSCVSRVAYLCMKIVVFFLCASVLIVQAMSENISAEFIRNLNMGVLALTVLTVGFSFVRFICLVFDSRKVLKEAFEYGLE